ncbi:MAG: DUF3786 domain-containing protein [Dethiobacteria bacterium]
MNHKKGGGFLNLETTLKYAANHFSAGEPHDIASKSAVEYDQTTKIFTIQLLDKKYTAHYPSGEVFFSSGEKAPLYQTIIILHYLNTADGTPLAGRWISFRELPGGQIYAEPFRKRAMTPFLNAFGDSAAAFVRAASNLGGFPHARTGKNSMVIPVLPRVPVNLILHEGDEEFPAAANILFDAHAASYLPTEDYAHLPALIIREMQASLK